MTNETTSTDGPASTRGRVHLVCDHCGDEFTRPAGARRQRPEDRVFCGRECYLAGGTTKGEERSRYYDLRCAVCETEFRKRRTDVKDPEYAFCSKACYFRRGKGTPTSKRGGRPKHAGWEAWKGSALPEINQAVSKYGEPESQLVDRKYLAYRWPNHPAANTNGRVHAHRVVAFEHAGEGIRGMHVDHINNDGMDNRWENLQLLSPEQHGKKTAREDRAPAGFWDWARAQPDILARWEAERNLGV